MVKKVLIITGMHRSGTSLTAQYLSECGLNVGYNLHNSDISNPLSAYDGHHEDQDFIDFHKAILKRKRLYSFPTREFGLPVHFNRTDKVKALALLSTREHLPFWGWKDPRTTLFLEAWHEIIPNANYLLLFRSPLAVVDSLIRRKTDPQIVKQPVIALRSWFVYNRQILKFLKKHQNISLIYEIDQLVCQPLNLVESIRDQVGIELNQIPFDQVFSQKSLKNQASDLVEQIKIKHPREVARSLNLYAELQNIALNQGLSVNSK